MNRLAFVLATLSKQTSLYATAFTVTTCAHLKGDAGFFVEVDLSDNSSCFLLHVKDAAAVGRPVQVHSIADKTGWGTLKGDENRGGKKTSLLFAFSKTVMLN